MSEKHTAGGWNVGETYNTHDHPTRYWRTYVDNDKGLSVAQTFGVTKEEAEANARCIAAAPALFEKSRRMVAAINFRAAAVCDRNDDSKVQFAVEAFWRAVDELNEAIALATNPEQSA
jgi:DNA-binding IclR family transcriptional regulator